MTAQKTARRYGVTMLALLLSACGSGVHYRPVSDTPVRVGRPYAVRGTTYVPAADPAYDRLGYASWYGPESGSQTANGERFRPDGISGAHTTLPLPSYVEVTALETGRVIVVRVNDRGPFTRNGRLIDLSRGAAQLLGIRQSGVAPVRLRVVEPSAADRARLRAGQAAAPRPAVSPQMLAQLRTQLAQAGAGSPVSLP
ncbi:septal ring lytic transglycosylase RlpA family protein [Novosphingobium rosa]|uniref:septal ring lytic transglycosylase RlpA family protein n=1 Tax=Novosphingobium rosa TaxID=76978 RepID=UPI0008303D7A|nr:septal ring lytic transglycosylase RlpA family protein [Novosphingobium rosa]